MIASSPVDSARTNLAPLPRCFFAGGEEECERRSGCDFECEGEAWEREAGEE